MAQAVTKGNEILLPFQAGILACHLNVKALRIGKNEGALQRGLHLVKELRIVRLELASGGIHDVYEAHQVMHAQAFALLDDGPKREGTSLPGESV